MIQDTHDGVLDIGRSNLGTERVNVLDPFMVLLEAISGDTNDLDVSLLEVFSTSGDLTELSSADGGKVSRVREEDRLMIRLDQRAQSYLN